MNNLEIVERMKTFANVKEDQELAKIFGLGKTAIANWKRGTAISLSHIFDFSQKYDCDLNWLLTGESKEKQLEPVAAMLLSGFNGLSDAQKLKAVTFVGNLASGAENSTSSNSTTQNSGQDSYNIGGDVMINQK